MDPAAPYCGRHGIFGEVLFLFCVFTFRSYLHLFCVRAFRAYRREKLLAFVAVNEQSGLGHDASPRTRRERHTPSHRLNAYSAMTVKLWSSSPVPDIFCENSWVTRIPTGRFRDLRTSRQPGRRPGLTAPDPRSAGALSAERTRLASHLHRAGTFRLAKS
jgi:hypothetical protein